MSNPLYISQLAFTTGEVSPDVSSRFDLEQYKSALLEADKESSHGQVIEVMDMLKGAGVKRLAVAAQ